MDPLKARPIGLRAAATMTASGMAGSPVVDAWMARLPVARLAVRPLPTPYQGEHLGDRPLHQRRAVR